MSRENQCILNKALFFIPKFWIPAFVGTTEKNTEITDGIKISFSTFPKHFPFLCFQIKQHLPVLNIFLKFDKLFPDFLGG